MENQNSSYSVQIGKTTFIVCVKQSETAKKPIEKIEQVTALHRRHFVQPSVASRSTS